MTRKNPKRSGGPQSPKGKAVTAQNAIKLGTYSALPVLPGENPEEFNQLVDHFNHDFHPADITESALVRDLAVLAWKKLRLERLENDYLIKKSNAPITLEEFIDCGLKFNEARFNFWVKHQFFNDEKLDLARRSWAYIKPLLHTEITPVQLQEIKALNHLIYDAVVSMYRQAVPFVGAEINEYELLVKTAHYPDQPRRLITSLVFEKFIEFYEAGFWCAEHQSEIEQAILQIKQERILKIMQSDSTRRANDDLSRSLMRTLSEYRKHHQWRMQNRVIDADEE